MVKAVKEKVRVGVGLADLRDRGNRQAVMVHPGPKITISVVDMQEAKGLARLQEQDLVPNLLQTTMVAHPLNKLPTIMAVLRPNRPPMVMGVLLPNKHLPTITVLPKPKIVLIPMVLPKPTLLVLPKTPMVLPKLPLLDLPKIPMVLPKPTLLVLPKTPMELPKPPLLVLHQTPTDLLKPILLVQAHKHPFPTMAEANPQLREDPPIRAPLAQVLPSKSFPLPTLPPRLLQELTSTDKLSQEEEEVVVLPTPMDHPWPTPSLAILLVLKILTVHHKVE